jgi:hypothetical protein
MEKLSHEACATDEFMNGDLMSTNLLLSYLKLINGRTKTYKLPGDVTDAVVAVVVAAPVSLAAAAVLMRTVCWFVVVSSVKRKSKSELMRYKLVYTW